jgi:D-amino-acid oxidase
VRVIVVGAGVVGLSAALRCAQAGHDVAVLGRDLPLETTSAVAAALWYPYRAQPQELVGRWAAAGYAEMVRLATSDPEAGVDLRDGVELLREPATEPWWAAALPVDAGLSRLGEDQVPRPYRGGYRLRAPVIDMAVHLPWLRSRLEALGATVTRCWLDALPEPRAGVVVVNASGLAARGLAGDPTLLPVRGQVVRLSRPPGLDEWLLDQSTADAPVYVVPRRSEVVVGGTAQEGEWDPQPNADTAELLLARACALVPALRGAAVLGHRVGLRPARPAVRLEAERQGEGTVVHCYGHGGSGVTLAWGCADEVAQLVGEGT